MLKHILATLFLTAGAALAQPSIMPLDFSAQAISADGRVVVGGTGIPPAFAGGRAVYWTRATGTVDLGVPDSFGVSAATAVSGDGSAIAITATLNPPGTVTSWVWTQADLLTEITVPGMVAVRTSCITRDGTQVGGAAVDSNTGFYEAFLWSRADGGRAVPRGGNYATWLHAIGGRWLDPLSRSA